MGPYCNYCDKRCFVDNTRKGGYLLATCPKGQEHDKKVLGYCYSEILDELVKRKVSMTFTAIEGEDLDTLVVAQLTKRQQDAIWHIIYSAEPVAIGHSATKEQDPPQPKIPGFQTVEYQAYEITGPYIWEINGDETFLVFPKGGQVAVYEAPLATMCKRWIDEEAP
jgi:hypothetical protein